MIIVKILCISLFSSDCLTISTSGNSGINYYITFIIFKMSENLQKNRKLVEQVFNKVYDKYDLMNDIMSLGSHEFGKKSYYYDEPDKRSNTN